MNQLSHDMRVAARVLDAIRDAGIDPETDEDAGELLASECELPDRLVRMIRVARREEAEASGIDSILKELAERKARRKAKAGGLRDIVRDAMAELGLSKLPAPDLTVSLSKGKVPLVITDEAAIPDALCRITRSADKTAIRNAMDAGNDVTGAAFGNPVPTLTVRVR